MIHLLTPKENETVTLLSKKHLDYIAHPRNDPTSKVDWLALRETQEDLSYPVPLPFSFSPAVDGELVLCDPNGREYSLTAESGTAYAENLLIGAEYRWFVRIDGECSETRTFRTDAQVPRMLRVDGISNVRDFGGFLTEDGRRVRQAMIYRTSEMDTHVQITEGGKQTLETELGVRTDLDLRGIKDEPRCPVLDETRVKWVNVPLAAYEEIFTEEQIARYGESYRILLDAQSYPLIVHCWGGIDRTGTWLYILGAMLGVSEDDLGLDYEMSSFARWNRRSRHSDQFRAFRAGLSAYGESLQDAAAGFMKAAGLTDGELTAIRKILLS
ncbi:MAG: tyrosine-protein phosphatase [Clostridia bacterium]|nr:tyrosine-protein phosphatase [Clostridia bacterium]